MKARRPAHSMGIGVMAAVVLGSVWTGLARAQETWWQHDLAAAGDWFIDENWTNGVPTAAGHAYIDNGGTAYVSSGLAEGENLYVGYLDRGQFLQTGGTTRISWEYGGYRLVYVAAEPGSQGTMDIQGGIFDFDRGQLAVGNSGTGLLRQTGGEVTGNHVVLGFLEGSGGTYEISGEGVLAAGDMVVGRQGTGLLRQIGGHVSAGSIVYVGLETEGTYEMHAGRLDTKELQIGHMSQGGFIQYGGDVTISGYSSYIDNGLQLAYGVGSTVGSYTMHGGSLTVERHAVIGRTGRAGSHRSKGTVCTLTLLSGSGRRNSTLTTRWACTSRLAGPAMWEKT